MRSRSERAGKKGNRDRGLDMYNDVMYIGRYVWNKEKAAENIRKHGIRFEEAVTVFYDPFSVDDYDDKNSDYEDRYTITGIMKGVAYVTVSYTVRGNLIRVFSARDADPDEEEAYDKSVRDHIGKR
jgi:uncharacterized DUF497 family protein